MKRHLLNIAITASSLLALTACSDDVMMQENNDSGKSPIELSVGGVENIEPTTRAVVTNGDTPNDFGRNTKVFILMQSDKRESFQTGLEYLSYTGSRANTLYSVSRGDVKYDIDHTKLEFDDINKRYWDDAHARSSQLTLWAFAQRIAQPTIDGTWKSCSFQSYNGTTPSLEESKKMEFDTTTKGTNPTLNFQSTNPIYPAIYAFSVGNPDQDENTIIYQDLLFSNNIANYTDNEKIPEASRKDNRLKFDTNTRKFPSAELKFYHAMSKITIQIKKGDGYTDSDPFAFASGTNIKLTGFNTKGLFNIKDGEFQKIHNHDAIKKIALTKTDNTNNNPYYTLEALAIPNIHEFMVSQRTTELPDLSDIYSRFVDGKKDYSTDVMMEFSIDNNNYKLTSGQLYDALCVYDTDGVRTDNVVTNATKKTDNSTNYIPLEAGKNYVFTFTVTKTGIEATATVKPWDDVKANNVTPLINFSKCYGSTGDNFGKGFTFYRSTSKDNNYLETNNSSSVTYNSTGTPYTMSPKLYWQDHSTHYFFRGIWPAKATEASQTEINNGYTPSAKIKTTDNKTVVDVQNVGYKNGTFPSDLMIGVPRKTETIDGKEVTSYDETCKADHKTEGTATPGICATQATTGSHDNEGLIHLNFQYAMSQVEVRLTTPTTGDDAKAKVRLEGAKVEIVDGYTTGNILLGNEEAVTTGDRGNFEIPAITSSDARDGIPAANIRHAAVIPQALTWTEGTETKYLRFKVTITNGDGTTDIYYTDIAPIKKSDQTKIAPNGKWEAGTHYVYTLDIRKTGIERIKATITDWKKVTATESVWF